MKLFYDARHIRVDFPDGISRYSSELLRALYKIQPFTVIIHDRSQLSVLPPGIDYVVTHNISSMREFFMARLLNKHRPDVVFSPMQLMGRGARGRKYHLILTIHDLIYYQHHLPPRNLPLFTRLIWRLFHLTYWPERWLLSQADIVVTVSETTKKLIKKHHLTSRPIKVIYNAPAPLEAPPKPPELTKNLLYMGSFMPYKNVETLIKALFFLPGYTLHCLSPINPADKQRLKALAPPHQLVFHGGVSEKQYARLLSSAFAQVTASKSEGFGLPIIEAMAAGAPVVCSDIEIFHEVAGEGALFFDPNNPADFSKKVLELEDPSLRAALVKKAHLQANKFSWEHSAATLLKTIKLFID